ncbi:methionyl-tRNA formyltransferase [Hirschia baltica]|uniref:Methionyl-tRNA formyltransferase n=1 Tax=Hirschia baltica (strain ATCC 49814 / DSM 5838 / IFAM 1418) TaxID=582402 RepID=C6XQ45_HIRBI|nr:methionyl-tRNA formyltransferase [Hirschia baltica]ACT58562.1 methionyl-tRNA formyltransferase [Hirschia baltica ATCC 49814]
MSLRLVFMGSPDFSVPCLKALVDAGHDIVCVYSQPPRRAGRGKNERNTPVHDAALELGIEVRTPKSVKSEEALNEFAALEADLAVVVAYGLILPQALLDAPRLGCINAHASLLPRWRGAAPIQRAIMAGDDVTGVEIMQMEAGLDTGPVMASVSVDITPETTVGSLHDELCEAGAKLLVEAVAQLEAGTAKFIPQSEEGIEYAHKLTNEETRIDWSLPARKVRQHIHGLSPFPGAWFEMQTPKGPVRVKVLEVADSLGEGNAGEVLDDKLLVACGKDAIRIKRLQRAGKPVMNAEDFLRGNDLTEGAIIA